MRLRSIAAFCAIAISSLALSLTASENYITRLEVSWAGRVAYKPTIRQVADSTSSVTMQVAEAETLNLELDTSKHGLVTVGVLYEGVRQKLEVRTGDECMLVLTNSRYQVLNLDGRVIEEGTSKLPLKGKELRVKILTKRDSDI